MKLADEFIQKYNELDDWLRRQAGENRDISFSKVVSVVAQKNRAVKPSEYFLKSIGNLSLYHRRAAGRNDGTAGPKQ